MARLSVRIWRAGGNRTGGTGVYFGVDGARKTPFIITAAHVGTGKSH